ncbi:ubiquinone biosynthesis regulatory protein kinase UbiB [Pleionea mediterranea]|uniref:Probable protein kinase UbiB n=1 Tax=Pleionea mediterranea TaxID=523701 RepID=A0A316FKD7_9GAMM|nr:ubiquinone biosynthesis regulatory protein kinase UbiB [Pleionea mediterranea]PWK48582.1 2-octaprenylphenol hydroxylase [Pleionea mediterranea]
MMIIKNFHRIFAINRVLIKHGLDEFLQVTPLGRYAPLLKLFALTSRKEKQKPRGERLREALIELGPIFIKFGQMLSTRRDLISDDLAEQLMRLQDRVDPFDENTAKARIEDQLGQSTDSVFNDFQATPLASASIAQVHSAELLNGEQVVVKVIRPGIRKQIQRDLSLLKLLAGWFEDHAADGKRFKPRQVIADYEFTIYNELDLRAEAANTMQLRRNFADSTLLYVPKVYWDFTREKVMVQEKISGIPIANIAELNRVNTNMKVLAHRGVEIFFTQVFRDSFFHADMHPGNIFVDASDPQNPKYIGIDCGIMGTLGEQDKRYLAENFLAFFDRDYRRIAELHIESGWIPENTPVEAFESAIRTACEPIFGKPLSEISFGHFLIQLFQVARRFQMEVQPQLVLLQKTLLYVEGLGRQLYPQLDLWETAQPYLREWVKQHYGPQAIWKKITHKWPMWIEQLPEMPEKLATFLDNANQPPQQLTELVTQLTRFNEQQKKRRKMTVYASLGVSITLFSGLLFLAHMPQEAASSLLGAALAFILAVKNS